MYETWNHVIGDVRGFIKALYLSERIDSVLGRQSGETVSGPTKLLEGSLRLGGAGIATLPPQNPPPKTHSPPLLHSKTDKSI
jgi:hypothetical protein